MDYNVLRKTVAGCVEGKSDSRYFRINAFKLTKKVKELGLIPMLYSTELNSKDVTPSDVPLLAEYYKGEYLNWFNGEKTFICLTFLRQEDMTEELEELLEKLQQARKEMADKINPSRHKNVKEINNNGEISQTEITSTVITILSKYPCYHAVIGKWVKEEEIRLNIRFRANSVLLTDENSDKKESE